jgi:LysM repeat protein
MKAVEVAAAQETPVVQEYVIKSGDTLNAIARNLGVTVRVICELNGIENPNRIRAGRTIKY